MSEARSLCNHPEDTRFYARDAEGCESMMCGICGNVYTLLHACGKHVVIQLETRDAIFTQVYGEDVECDDVKPPTLEELLRVDA